MRQVTHKGDHLTFASLGLSADLPYGIMNCEYLPGVFRRYSEKFESRSSISRDGYLGLLHYIVAKKDKKLLNRIIKAGWKRNWDFDTMPELNSSKDYTNMAPLIPLFYALKWHLNNSGNIRKFLTQLILTIYVMPPILKAKTGYRAHLGVLGVLLAMRVGIRSKYHEIIMKDYVKYNKQNPLFRLMYLKLSGKPYDYSEVMQDFEPVIGCHGWGSCEPDVFEGLCRIVDHL